MFSEPRMPRMFIEDQETMQSNTDFQNARIL
jgi:hypothetical protein